MAWSRHFSSDFRFFLSLLVLTVSSRYYKLVLRQLHVVRFAHFQMAKKFVSQLADRSTSLFQGPVGAGGGGGGPLSSSSMLGMGGGSNSMASAVPTIADDEDGHLAYKLGDVIEHEYQKCESSFY